ncbi:sensor histidine kinase [Spirosoma linguale]|uniref:histidine kinase n=1 Tax=Spirosoma linguale (strain ATCC 33905 / DSM 74 / LMG 10896 / Claus 1) TaxID=504472 RepID=D2QLG4_SPILD|nr:histidine kinase [Spirosoma linguale DSM 74]
MNLKTLLPFLLALTLLTVVILIDRHNFNQMRNYTIQVDRSRDIINRLERLSNHFKSVQIYSPAAAAKAPVNFYQLYKFEAAHLRQELTQLHPLLKADSTQYKRLLTVNRLIERHWSTLMVNNIGELIQQGQGWRLNDLFRVHQLINQAVDYENALRQCRQQELTRSTTISQAASNTFSLVALVILLVTFGVNVRLNHRRKMLQGFLASILNTSRNGIVNLQPVRKQDQVVDFKVDYANAAAEDLLGISPTQIKGQHLLSLPGFESGKAELMNHFLKGMNTDQAEPFEWLLQINGATVWLYVISGQHNGGLTVTLQDITSLKHYQQDLQTKIEQLNRSNEDLQQFASIASHDLQEPLRKVQSFGDILRDQYSDQLGEGVYYLLRMQNAATRMSVLIKDLLSFSRISTGEPSKIAVNLEDIVQKVLSDLDLQVAETRAAIDVGVLPTLPGNASQLRQLFQNLLSNALKFHSADSTPVIRITCQPAGADELPAGMQSVQPTTAYHCIDVIDNGIGFEEKYLDRIFQIFQRLHGKQAFAGTGIGLAICAKVVANHGGFITARSQTGQGTTFSVYLPV